MSEERDVVDQEWQGASQWQEPGVRLTQQVLSGGSPNDDLPSAVPVFIGWLKTAGDEGATRLLSIASWDQVQAYSGTWPASLLDSVQHYFDNGGGPCWVLQGNPPSELSSLDSLARWWEGLLKEASDLLLGEPTITLVASPQLVLEVEVVAAFFDQSEKVVPMLIEAWKALLNACRAREDLFFVLDAPADPKVATACIQALRGEQALGERGEHAALYGPHLITDYRKGFAEEARVDEAGLRVVPPSGAVLGVYVRSDALSGVWKAPANEVLAHVVRPQVRETLASGWFDVAQVPINLIRSFAGRGTRVWGCRTLAASPGSAFRYVQVRRMVTWIEANLKRICRFAVFEPNHEITWFQLRGLCNAWLRRVWLEGGLAGADEASAYSVRVGLNESMTAADIEAGCLIIQVGVAVLHAAEFIEVKLVLKVGDEQASGTDLLGSQWV
ncbi:phage tail sheath family protein [Pseudomonas aeruginosa]|nr:hypothetical protein [Pseudomonas aeruginosa]HCL3290486.1 hypothetical protein [Pseudomonas aeruginosa]